MQHVRLDILDAARSAVAERPNQYGSPENNFARIAARWNVHLANIGHVVTRQGIPCRLEAHDVALMLADVKIARLENDPSHRDSWVDLAGYAACGGEVAPLDDEAMHASLPPQHQERQTPSSERYRLEDAAAFYTWLNTDKKIPDELTCWPPIPVYKPPV